MRLGLFPVLASQPRSFTDQKLMGCELLRGIIVCSAGFEDLVEAGVDQVGAELSFERVELIGWAGDQTIDIGDHIGLHDVALLSFGFGSHGHGGITEETNLQGIIEVCEPVMGFENVLALITGDDTFTGFGEQEVLVQNVEVETPVAETIHLTARQEKIIAALKKNNFLTEKELAEKFAVTPRTIERDLAKLQQYGTLERVGSKRDGRWIVKALPF